MLDPNREDKLSLLSSLGIELPATTKMSDSLLSKRLERALDAAQYLPQVFPSFADPANSGESAEVTNTGTIDIPKLAAWTEKDVERSLRRQSLKEGFGLDEIERAERERMTGKVGPPPTLDPFHTLRCLVIMLGEEVDSGTKELVMEDTESGHAMFIKEWHLDVRKVDDKTPLLVVQYRLEAKSRRKGPMYSFWNLASTSQLSSVRFSTRSLMLIHRLLLLNSGRVPRGSGEYRSANLETSFILPVGPIEKPEVARLIRDLSCAVCGKQSKMRCSQCQIEVSLSTLPKTKAVFAITTFKIECQKQNWAAHKKTCNNLAGATWSTMRFGTTSLPVPKDGAYIVRWSMEGGGHTKVATKAAKRGEEKVPPNEHGENPFLIKVQYNGSPEMMVYDRTRALETFFNKNENPRMFDQLAALVKEKGFMGMKIYVWAKRTGDFELSLALDKIPSQNVPW
ncbi:hypothetical protein FS837_003679 [Tulasnella sp. UAMH 9824]|nr:hypothetical protein FS837_003679 [Tulasnella sp. UAMH 9824]